LIFFLFFPHCHHIILDVTIALGYPVELPMLLAHQVPCMTNWICPSIKKLQWLVLLPMLLILLVQSCLGPAPKRVYEESAFARGQDQRSKTGQRNRIETLEAFLGLTNGFKTVS